MRTGDVDGRRLAAVVVDVKLDLLPFGQGAETFSVDCRLVNEDVGTAVAGGDKTEAFLGIEPLDSSCYQSEEDEHV